MSPPYISDIEAGMARRLAAMPERIRLFTRETADLPRAALVTGPRGVGKTTFLLHRGRDRNLLYFSADNPRTADEPLYDLVKSMFHAGYAGVMVDEIHYARDWSIHLKALYDDFPQHTLWISDSSSLVLRSGVGDLSRRFLPITMPLLSFREYIALRTGREYPIVDPFSGKAPLPLQPTPDLLSLFREYRRGGTRPFYAEGNFEDRLLAVLDKALYADIPFFLPGVTDGNLRLMKAITGTLAKSPIPRLQVRSLCADWGIGADKLNRLLEVMESVGILRIIRIENDTKAKSVGHKLFFSDPAFYPALGGDLGTEREALVAALCADAGWAVEAARDETEGDFIITKSVGDAHIRRSLEIGGKSKKTKKADYVIRDDLDYPGGNAVPLWLLGMSH